MLFLLRAGDFVVLTDPSQHVPGYDRVMPVINDSSLFWVLVLVMAISVLVMVLEIYRVVLGGHALLRTRAPPQRT
jgi:hypothetical protein